MPTKSDSDLIFCLQLLSKTPTSTLHFSLLPIWISIIDLVKSIIVVNIIDFTKIDYRDPYR